MPGGEARGGEGMGARGGGGGCSEQGAQVGRGDDAAGDVAVVLQGRARGPVGLSWRGEGVWPSVTPGGAEGSSPFDLLGF